MNPSNMSEEFLANSGEFEPPARLYGAVLGRLQRERDRARWLKTSVSAVVALSSLGALVPSTQLLIQGFRESSFSSYLSLALSDGRAIMSFWGEYLLSLIDSLPLAGLASVALASFIFLSSFKYVIGQVSIRRVTPRLA